MFLLLSAASVLGGIPDQSLMQAFLYKQINGFWREVFRNTLWRSEGREIEKQQRRDVGSVEFHGELRSLDNTPKLPHLETRRLLSSLATHQYVMNSGQVTERGRNFPGISKRMGEAVCWQPMPMAARAWAPTMKRGSGEGDSIYLTVHISSIGSFLKTVPHKSHFVL